ncbi:hypothetical protein ZWY2020_034103 [Hordeum vulgare]|nr:hypothetical protein ZWY2020_034103 [Hordeum vulgare]
MVSDLELVERLREVPRDSDLTTTTTTGALRCRLEEDFGVDLSDKKTFVREQFNLVLSELDDKAELEDALAEKEDPREVTSEAGEGGVEKGEGGKQHEGKEEEEGEEDEDEEDEESGAGRKKKRR